MNGWDLQTRANYLDRSPSGGAFFEGAPADATTASLARLTEEITGAKVTRLVEAEPEIVYPTGFPDRRAWSRVIHVHTVSEAP